MMGAATAALTETVRESSSRRASLVATAATTGGGALGPLMAGLFAQYLPQPTVLVFEVIGSPRRRGAGPGFRTGDGDHAGAAKPPVHRFVIPVEGRGEFIAAGVAAFAA